jgi:hypothetical protein
MLNELAQAIHENAKSKGFYDNGKAQNMGERLALIHSEISEALEADREGRYVTGKVLVEKILDEPDDKEFIRKYKTLVKGSFEEELADMIIRPLDMGAHKEIDIDLHVKAKMRFNSLREHMHGKKY